MNNTDPTYQSWEDLVTDLDFIAWVKTNGAAHTEWEKRIPSDVFDEWVRQAKTVVESMRFSETSPSIASKEKMWKEISGATASPQAKIRRMNIGAWAAAASILIFAAVGWIIWSTPTKTSLNTDLAEQRVQILPDNSQVTLNAKSKISYIEAEWQDERKLSLEGEAFFEVEKGSDFVVSTPIGEVRVLGTSFNVLSRDNLLEVHCYTGKVAVRANNSEVTLLPGDWARLKGDILNSYEFVPDTEKLWINGYFAFEDRKIRDVFDEMQRQYRIRIDDSKLSRSYTYTGFFASGDLNKALETVCWPLRLRFEVKDDKVTIFEE
jgi:ferric-dicitrate binding protein FerR (iron transport regulator)